MARERERAEKRLQTLTKEVDWRVAKAYVALADGSDVDADSSIVEGKEGLRKRHPGGSNGLEGRAIDRYLDDEEWEAKEGREGRWVAIQPFPYFAGAGASGKRWEGGSSGKVRSFWRWKS